VSRKQGFSEHTSGVVTGASEHGPLARRLLGVVDGGLAGCIFVVPMIMGGRQALGRLTLAALAVAVALAWTLRQCLRAELTWRRSVAAWLLAAGVLLLIVQLVPLPPAILEYVAPHTSEILPLWNANADSPAQLGVWSRVSLTPAATQSALVIFIAYGLVFLVTVQRIQVLEDVERLVRWCALSALLMAAFGIVQLLTSNGKFFWVYEHVYRDTRYVATGAFTNRNHFAHFLCLGIGPLIWWVQQGLAGRRQRQTCEFRRSAKPSQASELRTGFRVVALGIVLFAVLLSLSRGGALTTLLAVAICLAVCYRAASIGPKFVVTLGAAALLIGASLTIFGHDRVARRLGTLTAGSLDAVDSPHGRRTIWSTVAKAIPDYAALGSGVGSHREVYPMYLEWTDSHKYYSHAECGYLQVTLESGMVGLALLLSGIGVCGFWCIAGLRAATSNRMLVCMGAVSASLAASAAHSFVDFVWYVPGCMAMVVVLAACASRLWQLAADKSARQARPIRLPRHVGVVGVVGLLVLGAWMLDNRFGPVIAEPHWDRFLMLDRDSAGPLPFDMNEPGTSATDDQYESSLAESKKAVAELESVVRWEPEHARAHLRLAEAYIRLFHEKQRTSPNVMSVNQIRDAVIDSRSETVPPERRLDSREKLEKWLSAAIGDHYRHLDVALAHVRQGLAHCPLLGEAYLFLGELCFLEGGRNSAKSAYIAQALKVRPFDGTVLLHAGSEAILTGHFDQGLAYWQESFRRGPVYQEEIIEWLVGRVHPRNLEEETRFFIETFQPDLEGLRLLERRYRKVVQAGQMTPDQMAPLRLAYAQAAGKAARHAEAQEAAALWLEAMAQYGKLEDPARRLECGRNALRCDPNSSEVRERLAHCLVELGQFAEAKEHLSWCLRRKPHDESLAAKMEEVVQKEIRQGFAGATGDRARYGRPRGQGPANPGDDREAVPPQHGPTARRTPTTRI